MRKFPAKRTISPPTKSAVHGLQVFASLAFFVVILLAKSNGNESVSRWAIPAFVGMWALDAAWTSWTWSGAARWTWTGAFALVFSGDFLINLTPWGKFSAVSFALAHSLFIGQYLLVRPFRIRQIAWLLPVAAASVAYLAWTLPLIPQQSIAITLCAYLVVLSVMLWRAICTALEGGLRSRGAWILPGATLFYVVDLMVCRGAAEGSTHWVIRTWICYPAALVCLGISAWHRASVARRTGERR